MKFKSKLFKKHSMWVMILVFGSFEIDFRTEGSCINYCLDKDDKNDKRCDKSDYCCVEEFELAPDEQCTKDISNDVNQYKCADYRGKQTKTKLGYTC